MMLHKQCRLIWILIQIVPVLCIPSPFHSPPEDVPLVHISNGTLAGVHSPIYDQDFFLGVPYAAPPVGRLRFNRPEPPQAWNRTIRQANKQGPWCPGNSLNLIGFSQNMTGGMSEDCLHINIVRPSSPFNDAKASPLLPVLVWIHGGSWQEGSANEGRYNGSFLVQRSVEMGTLIIYVNFNYRLGLFGRLSGPAIVEAGLGNLLVQDQRQAFAWIQENIVHFGGDKSRVTIMGESAGAGNVGHHLLAPDQGFFSGAIAESSGPFSSSPLFNETEREAAFAATLNATGCTDASEPLDCLRSVSTEVIQNASTLVPLGFVQDGEFIIDQSSRLLKAGQFVKVSLLIGSNRNDGTTLIRLDIATNGVVNNLDDFIKIASSSVGGRALPNNTLRRLWQLYQDEIDNPSPAGLGTVIADGGSSLGSGYGKASLWMGDTYFAAGRRWTNQIWAEHGIPSYSFLFDTTTAYLSPELDGAAHFQEIPYVFGNKKAVGWEESPFPAEPHLKAKHLALLEAMSSMWISFVATGSPDNHKVLDLDVTWPNYTRGDPRNIVFSATEGVHVQPDTWRSEALQLIVDLADESGR